LLASCINQNKSTLNLRWTEAKARSWYDALPWIKGFNYVPSYAGNTTEWWENPLDTTIIGRELGWAHDLRYTSTRVFLQYIVWKSNPVAFKKNFSLFLELASSRHISVMPVLFDDCAFGQPVQMDPYLGKQPDIITYHLYGKKDDMAVRIAELKKQNRPVLCSEWMARPAGSS